MKLLILMRGTPGTGKSHEANLLTSKDKIFSTDAWFDLQPGGYVANWSQDKLFKAHCWNQDRTKAAIALGTTPLVVDNTNLQMKAARVYFDMGVEAGYEVQIREPSSPWWLEIKELMRDKKTNQEKLKDWSEKLADGFSYEGLIIKNVHNVPASTILKMFNAYQPYTVEDLFSTSNREE